MFDSGFVPPPLVSAALSSFMSVFSVYFLTSCFILIASSSLSLACVIVCDLVQLCVVLSSFPDYPSVHIEYVAVSPCPFWPYMWPFSAAFYSLQECLQWFHGMHNSNYSQIFECHHRQLLLWVCITNLTCSNCLCCRFSLSLHCWVAFYEMITTFTFQLWIN